MQKEYTVYMLKCVDDSFYIGITSDLPKRLWQHQFGFYTTCYTFKKRPIQLVYTAAFQYVLDAIDWEKRIKKWSRRKKKALIKNDSDKLNILSQCQNDSHHLRKRLHMFIQHSATLRLRSG